MICEHCGAFFCPDGGVPDAPPRRYCDTRCAKNASAKRTGRNNRRIARRDARREERARAAAAAVRVHAASCGRKIAFMSPEDADAGRRATGGEDWGHVYRCLSCWRWHITSKRPDTWMKLAEIDAVILRLPKPGAPGN